MAANLVWPPSHRLNFTLIFVKHGNNLLLGLKKRGFGEGKWNAFGGKVEENESIVEGAIRELREESCIETCESDMKYLGCLKYQRIDTIDVALVYVFSTCKISNSIQETEEMRPKWFKFEEIPYDDMWPDTKFWVPLVLKDQSFRGNILYNNQIEVVDKNIEPLAQLEVLP